MTRRLLELMLFYSEARLLSLAEFAFLLSAYLSRTRSAKTMPKPPAIHVFIWRLTCRVVAAGQHRHLVVDSVAGKGINGLPRQLGQKSQIVGCVNDQRLLRPACELLKVRHRADAAPHGAQAVGVEMGLESLADVAGGLPVPYHIGHVGRSVIERRHSNTGIMRRRQECVTRAEAGAQNAKLGVAMLLQPIQTATYVQHALARGIEGASPC